MSIAECSGKRVSVLTAGFNNLSRKTLSDFDGLGDAAALRHQSRNVRAGAQVPSPFQGLYSDADSHFFNSGQMYLSFHDALRDTARLYQTLCQRTGQVLGVVAFSGAALFMPFVKGAGFSSLPITSAREESPQWHRLQSVGFRSNHVGRTSQDQSENSQTEVHATGLRERENRGSENTHS
jgi:hypothetical protein